MTQERWLPVVGHEGRYEVSDQGRVRSVERRVLARASWRRPAHWRTYQGRLLSAKPSGPFGYVAVVLARGGASVPVHHLVLAAFVGPRPRGRDVCHRDGCGSNNALRNLYYGTRSENNRDVSRQGKRKLTFRQVRRLRAERRRGASLADLSVKYRTCQSNVSYVASGRYYPDA